MKCFGWMKLSRTIGASDRSYNPLPPTRVEALVMPEGSQPPSTRARSRHALPNRQLVKDASFALGDSPARWRRAGSPPPC